MSLDTATLTDLQHALVQQAARHPAILRTGLAKTVARNLSRMGWGDVEPGASGEVIFRLNQAGETAVSDEIHSIHNG